MKVTGFTVSLELWSIALVRKKCRERRAGFPKRPFVVVQ